MARVKLDLPSSFLFSTELPVRITDINYGGHLGNDALLALLHEARVRFLVAQGWSEQNIDGVGLIMTDAVLMYKAEVFYGDVLRVEVTVGDAQATGCDVFYRVTEVSGGREVARAKTGMTFFDYVRRRPVAIPPSFQAMLERVATT